MNNDLPVALSNVSIDPDRTARYQDHCAVNAVLGSVTDRATRQIAALYAPGVDMLDDCAGELDELVSLFSLEVARESAWEAAVSLANARSPLEHRLVSTLIGSRATVMARLLLAPTAHPAVLRACRRVEESADVLSLIRAIKSDLHRGIPGC